MKPAEIAKKLGLSTNTLRVYEEWGLIPPPNRTKGGHRTYTEIDFARFQCIRAMAAGFSFSLIREVMKDITEGNFFSAFWKVNEAQYKLYLERSFISKAKNLLQRSNNNSFSFFEKRKAVSIGEAAKMIGIAPSALRHWDKEGLISLKRDPQNGYRLVNKKDMQRILLIRIIKSSIWSLEDIKEYLNHLDYSEETLIALSHESFEKLNQTLEQQFFGIQYLRSLCLKLGYVEDKWESMWSFKE